MYEVTEKILREVRKVIVGKDDVVEKVWISILAQGHVLLEDVPGVGKTTLAKAFSKTLGLDSKRVQFTSDTLPSDIIGFSVFDKADGKLKYQPGAIMTNLLLADEINRTSSKTQSALLEAMEELQVTVDGVTRPLPKPFIVLATENPVGSAGTQMLPASQLDRFMIQLSMGYPNRASTAALSFSGIPSASAAPSTSSVLYTINPPGMPTLMGVRLSFVTASKAMWSAARVICSARRSAAACSA